MTRVRESLQDVPPPTWPDGWHRSRAGLAIACRMAAARSRKCRPADQQGLPQVMVEMGRTRGDHKCCAQVHLGGGNDFASHENADREEVQDRVSMSQRVACQAIYVIAARTPADPGQGDDFPTTTSVLRRATIQLDITPGWHGILPAANPDDVTPGRDR